MEEEINDQAKDLLTLPSSLALEWKMERKMERESEGGEREGETDGWDGLSRFKSFTHSPLEL